MSNEVSTDVTAIVLAAGLGVRMQSKKPKILHAAAGRSMISHVTAGLRDAGVDEIRLVVGHGGDLVRDHLATQSGLKFFVQEKQLGTADAVKSAQVNSIRQVALICNGDHPLITSADYKASLEAFSKSLCDVLVVSAVVRDPKGFGRILRGPSNSITEIVEEKDATDAQRKIREVNTGQYVVRAEVLKELLPKIDNKNAKGEFYLTDLIRLALKAGKKVSVSVQAARTGRGVNNQTELAMASKALFNRKARELLEKGVVIIDPVNTYIEADVQIEAGTTIYPGCYISGATTIGADCVIESHCQIKNSKIGERVEVRWGTLVDSSEIKNEALVGPYARLRPESVIGEKAHVGNFVELKKTTLGAGAKANHLTYLGDAEIGEETNIGCGTITCNYAVDRKKYKTKIGKRVFVGSDTQFVAPISIGDDAVIGSGSTITKDVPAKALAVARGKQFIKPDYNDGEK
jgi:bifunctional UDP-N-acetylglucosamine pyrophosphorylase / glucosamine-1-phosphate N-acetyltransferase